MANVLVRINVQNQVGPVALDGVTVRVYEDDGTTFVAEDVTGPPYASGQVEFTLLGDTPGVDYIIRLSLDGWRFPVGSTQTINVTDPPAPDNDFGPYNAVSGSTAVPVTLVVSDDQVVPVGIQNARIFVYSDSDVFITELLTDSSGEAEIPLIGSAGPTGTTYIIRVQKLGVVFAEPIKTIAVLDPVSLPDTNIFDFVGHIVLPQESSDPDLCLVYGNFTNLSLLPVKRLRFEFKSCPEFVEVGTPPTPHGSGLLLAGYTGIPTIVREHALVRSVKVDTDDNGNISVELPREGYFLVHIHGLEEPFEITERIYVPDAPGANLLDLLYPYIQSVVYDTDPITVAAGETVLVDFTATFSNLESITAKDVIEKLLSFATADALIAEVSLFTGTQLLVKGLQAGSTTIVTARDDLYVVPRRPSVAALTVIPPVVTVT
jgi:hypothetical protein